MHERLVFLREASTVPDSLLRALRLCLGAPPSLRFRQAAEGDGQTGKGTGGGCRADVGKHLPLDKEVFSMKVRGAGHGYRAGAGEAILCIRQH